MLFSGLISGIVSVIPFKNQNYINKLKWLLPRLFLTALVTTLGILIFYKPVKYDEIEIPNSLNCKSLKQGEFLCESLTIIRVRNQLENGL